MTGRNPQHLRLWPGVLAVALQWLIVIGVPLFAPGATPIAILGGMAGALGVLVWWVFFSRVPRIERWGAIVLMPIAVFATIRFLDPSIAGGMMGMMFPIYVIPGLCLALVLWAVGTQSLSRRVQRATLVVAILLACGLWALARTEGITGDGHSQLAWRWSKSPEQQLLARTESDAVPPAPVPVAKITAPEPARPAPKLPTSPRPVAWTTPVWPGFRGPHRDDTIPGLHIKTDWNASPPQKLWSRPIGPGWSSFAVGDDLLYTQEQRGEFEVVACYSAATGKPVWTHRDAARFWESNGGPGPRGTPALHNGRVYTLGATGILNSLDAGTGAVIWTRNAASDTGAHLPGWGFASSPLVVDDLLIVAASGRLAAYDLITGTPRWIQKEGGVSYSSPQLLTLDHVAQIVFVNGHGAIGVAPADGVVLWKHDWPGSPILQPALTEDGRVLIATSDMSGGTGVRRVAVAKNAGAWSAEEVWTSTGLKPYFNDFVVHKGHAFGFDGGILSCIDLQDGKRKWKGGRYGHGQLLLLSDQDLLLVLSEEGELALVQAMPDQFTEIARVPALEGKTWNHLVLDGDVLLIRNGQEMAAFRLTRAGT